MYNRYIPQSDGSYRRNPVEEKPKQPQKQRPQQARPGANPEPQPCPAPPPKEESPCPSSYQPDRKHRETQGQSITAFFKQLLPKDFDTGDLLIVLLLLLIAGDCAEDQNTALLTLALYMFM